MLAYTITRTFDYKRRSYSENSFCNRFWNSESKNSSNQNYLNSNKYHPMFMSLLPRNFKLSLGRDVFHFGGSDLQVKWNLITSGALKWSIIVQLGGICCYFDSIKPNNTSGASESGGNYVLGTSENAAWLSLGHCQTFVKNGVSIRKIWKARN